MEGNEKAHFTQKFALAAAITIAIGFAVMLAASVGYSAMAALNQNPEVLVCENDVDGVNDAPGQKDLTMFCKDSPTIDPLNVTWNWDEILLTGANTADGCALFDTNLNGLADYVLCNAWNNGQTQVAGYPKLYSCNDSRSDRCPGNTEIPITGGTTCSISNAVDDPFPAGDAYPNDTKSDCSIDLADVGGVAIAIQLDACSYPSPQPNSDPSDCVASTTNQGNLNVIKDVDPDVPGSEWVMTVSGPTPFSDTLVGDDSTGIRAVDAGDYTIVETAGGTTNLADYTTTWACTLDGSALSSGTGTTTDVLSISNGDVVVCTFTNIIDPTSVVLSDFYVSIKSPNTVLLNWETATESDLIGFNLFRSTDPLGTPQKINDYMIESPNPPGTNFGNFYQHPDTDVKSGTTYFYWLEMILTSGSETSGPQSITVPYQIYLPFAQR